MSKLKIAIVGAGGRMGKMLIAGVLADPEMALSGALEAAAFPLLGVDAGANAGLAPAGVKITADPAAALTGADVAIVFATGGAADCAELAVKNGAAVVVGVTALSPEEKRRLGELAERGGRLVVSSNMSVGVNLLNKLVRETARTLGPDYDVEVVEMHHNRKKDAPSGTAMTLAEAVCEEWGWSPEQDLRHGRVGMVGARTHHEIGVHSLRGGDVVGDHTVIFAIDGERLELTHKASSRETFVHGALRAAKFLEHAAAGLYDMRDVLGFK